MPKTFLHTYMNPDSGSTSLMTETDKEIRRKIAAVFKSDLTDPGAVLLLQEATQMAEQLDREQRSADKIEMFSVVSGFLLGILFAIAWAIRGAQGISLPFALVPMVISLAFVPAIGLLQSTWTKLSIWLFPSGGLKRFITLQFCLPIVLLGFVRQFLCQMADQKQDRWIELAAVHGIESWIVAFVSLCVFYLFGGICVSFLGQQSRRKYPVLYFLHALLIALFIVKFELKKKVRPWNFGPRGKYALEALEDAARSLEALSKSIISNDRSFSLWTHDAFRKRAQWFRELKMAIALPKADTEEWFQHEMLKVLNNIAANDWDALPVSSLDQKQRLSWLKNCYKTLFSPIIILAGVYIVNGLVPPDMRGYLLFSAWAFFGLSAVSVLDPTAAERFLKLKDFPKALFDGKRKE